SSRRRHTRFSRDWSSDVCSSDLSGELVVLVVVVFYGMVVGVLDLLQVADVVIRIVGWVIEWVGNACRLVILIVTSRCRGVTFRRSEERRVGKGGCTMWRRDQ